MNMNYIFIPLQDSRYLYICMQSGNGVDPDQLATYKPADLDRHRFQNRIHSGSASYIKG